MPSNHTRSQRSIHDISRPFRDNNDIDKVRNAKPLSQKAMLSRALQKANTAVQLDNAQNLEGARAAYTEACDLLKQVLRRTTAEEDKLKLEAIRQTYESRIEELDLMGPWLDTTNKALPARPESEEFYTAAPQPDTAHRLERPLHQARSLGSTHVINHSNVEALPMTDPRALLQTQPQQKHGFLERRHEHDIQFHDKNTGGTEQQVSQYSFSNEASRQLDMSANRGDIFGPMDNHYEASNRSFSRSQQSNGRRHDHKRQVSRDAIGSTEQTRAGVRNTWLDTVGESGGSANSSVHSRTSSFGYRRKHIRDGSGNTETEFDTALDAAIEAAYDEGYEPAGLDDHGSGDANEEIVARVLRKVEIARERVRQTERNISEVSEDMRLNQQPNLDVQSSQGYLTKASTAGFYDDNSSDEEERLLEEMEHDYDDVEDFALHEQQDIVFHDRSLTTHSSQAIFGTVPLSENRSFTPDPTTNMSMKASHNFNTKTGGPAAPPPQYSLPELPMQRAISPIQSVRNRRLSGQNPKQLKIETSKLVAKAPTLDVLQQVHVEKKNEQQLEGANVATISSPQEVRSPPPSSTLKFENRDMVSPTARGNVLDGDDAGIGRSSSPSLTKLRKNFSSSSLRSMKSRNMSVSNIEDSVEMSPGPSSSYNFGGSRTPAIPALPTPIGPEFREYVNSSAASTYLFDDKLPLPTTPHSISEESIEMPVPLEPCPTDCMLRPFWLMRCLCQTIIHPKGGFLSSKLFVPRDVWLVKGVKLKNIDEKVANCDLLAAALLKLAQVDTCDADAVLEEMQLLEDVLEQVQASLSRKLGHEVGVQGSGALFKEASAAPDVEGLSNVPRSTSVSGKPSFSWRRLRSKNSGVGLSSAYINRAGVSDTTKDAVILNTLPMTTQPTSRPARRDLSLAQFEGPYATYLSSLARLFDAAQVIDQIARQVEDPGLRHADKTQVGLELCTRHAAEFFGFYVCRFALSDLSLLLEKFLKRGSEWVLG